MRFNETPLKSAFTIELEPTGDERGFFSRLFCVKEFAQHGIDPTVVQANDSRSALKGTLRGLHYQLAPMEETKLVRCIEGSIFDVIIDLRPSSETFKQWFGAELSASNRRMMFVPKGFAHGFITLADNSEVIYLVSQYYSKELERGLRWNDPAFNIQWPIAPTVVSERDNNHPDFDPSFHLNLSLTGDR